jgi:hypothetical protein
MEHSLHALSDELDLVTRPQLTKWTEHTPLLALKEHTVSVLYMMSWIPDPDREHWFLVFL